MDLHDMPYARMKRKLYSALFALFPVFNIYATGILPGISIGQILLLLSSIILLINNRCVISSHFLYYLLYAIFISILSILKPWVNIENVFYEVISLFLFFFIFNAAFSYANVYIVKKGVIYLALFSLSFFYLQVILSLFGINISGIIPFLPLSYTSETESFIQYQLGLGRFCSIFEEPAHYATFMSFALSMLLFSEDNKKHKYLILLIIISIILSKSSSGYFLLFATIAYFFFVKIKKSKYKLLSYSLCCLVGILLIIFFARNTDTIMAATRLSELAINPQVSEYGYSSYIRVIRGYIPFIEGSISAKIFGNGIGSLLSWVGFHPDSNFLSITDYNPNWINSFQLLLFSTGILGALLFLTKLFKSFLNRSNLGIILTLQYILCLISDGFLFTPISALFLYFILKDTSPTNEYSDNKCSYSYV